MTLLAQLISPAHLEMLMAKEEGDGIPGAIPTRQNNPLDLRHAPGETHPADAPDSVGSFATPEEGWAAADRQLRLYAGRGLTLRQAIYEFAPPSENNSAAYLQFVCNGLNCDPDIALSEALAIE